MNIHAPSLAIGAAIAAVAIIGVFYAMSTNGGSPFSISDIKQSEHEGEKPVIAENDTPKTLSISVLTENASPPLGDANAPITIVEFGDYQCFFCNKFFHDTEDSIVENYVKTGKAKILFKDFTIIGQDSVVAAHAAHCAEEQGKFWEYHDILYNHWTGENNGWASSENQLKFASDLGLDVAKFTECNASAKYMKMIQTSANDAKTLGFTGTPGFVFLGSNNKIVKITGAQPYEVFAKILDSKELQNN
ncbi:MAG TPA: thioredoxin domain-containing protein [Candidatus Nitrosotenuis sp.]|nr:thioredoxin domain-containing protein [Candidatus Nitrosotenuis sp.]